MSNNIMCSLENGSTKHSMSTIVSSCSPSFTCSPLTSKPFQTHLFGSMASPLSLPPSSHTAFPFPPNPLFLSSLNLFNPQSSMTWFSAHNALNTPLSLTTNEAKDIANNYNNDNNNNISKVENKYKDSTQAMLSQTKSNLSDKSDSSVTGSVNPDNPSQPSANDSERSARNHSENLNWLADVAISKNIASVPSSPLTNQPTHTSRSLYHPSLAAEMTAGQRLYSPRFGTSSSPTYMPYPTPNSPITSLNAMNGVRGPPPPGGHYSGSFVSNFNAYQQFSPTTAQNAISPFLVPNQLSVANTRPQTYTTGIESYHQNSHPNPHSHTHSHSHNAILSANSSSIASQSGLSTSSRSPSLHSSDSSLLSSGPFSSPPISSEPSEPQTKSMMRSIKDAVDCKDMTVRSSVHESAGIKRKSPSSPELNITGENNLYKLPFGREGSRKHRILKPPNISILEPNKSDLMTVQTAPLSAPPIPVVNQQDFLKRIGDSDIICYSNESIVDSNNCHSVTPFAHQRRRSVPHTSAHKSLPSLAPKDMEESQYLVPNENSLPIEGHNRLQYPVYFKKGSIIQLGNGSVKRVEEMLTQDFIDSATESSDLCADCSEVIKIQEKIKSCSVLLSFSVGRTKVPVTVEAPVEHPFFVFHKGWSSFAPERSQLRYGLKCRKLRIGDNCVSLTPRANSVPNLTQHREKTQKNANKTSLKDETIRANFKSKPSRKSKSPSDSPLSLVKCNPPSAPPNETSADVKALPAKHENTCKVESSAMSSPSDAVPMSSPSAEPQTDAETVKTVDRNRRHSAPDALDGEPSDASEPSNAS